MPRQRPHSGPLLAYPLVDGYVHHWLALGPYDQRLTTAPLRSEAKGAFQARILAELARLEPDYVNAVELDRVRLGDEEVLWEVAHCLDDHWLAWHGNLRVFSYRQTWGFVLLHSARAQEVTLSCLARDAARLWLNGQAILPVADGGEMAVTPESGGTDLSTLLPRRGLSGGVGREILSEAKNDTATCRMRVKLAAGANTLLLRLEGVGVGEMALMAALRVEQNNQHAPPVTVQLPTVTPTPRRRQQLEQVYAQARLDRPVYGKNDPVRLLSPARGKKVPVQLRLQKPQGAIYAETLGTLNSHTALESVQGNQLPNGALDAVVMAPFQQFYDEKLRARHTIPILVANRPFHPQPSAENPDARLVEALRAQVQQGDSLYTELAKMAFGWWEQVDNHTVESAVERVMAAEAGALPELLALITIRARMPAYRGFPQSLLPTIDRGLRHFAMQPTDRVAAWESDDESNELMLLAARHLVGQLYPDAGGAAVSCKTVSGKTVGAETLSAWLAERGRRGLRQWHSNHDDWVTVLAPLLTLAADEGVREMAAALLDMLAFDLAIHSFGGTFGASRARVHPAALRSGRFAPEASLTRLLWGVGGHQGGLEATVALALAGNSYALPDVIRAVALAQPAALPVQERHEDANLAAYKTPDYLLTSVQDYRAGQRGGREHIWQATLGPEALVFTNHPAAYQQAESAAPGWWVGNGVLPRVAQHHDTLIACYALPAGAQLPFTHAYFPIYAFDEHTFVDGWAFARVGEGYLALWAAPAFTLAENGPDAGRELRALGREMVWLCQMGRRATDGDFAAFQRKVPANAPQRHDERVTWTTPRGDTLAFGSSGPFLVNGQHVPLDHFPRHGSPIGRAEFPAEHLEIVYGENGLRLHF